MSRTILEHLVKEFEEKILLKLESIPSETERYLYFMAWLNTKLEEYSLGRIIIVGGFAVEVLTGATYRTLDIDIIIEGSQAKNITEKFLTYISKPKTSRVFLPKLQAIASKGIDIVGILYSKAIQPIKLRINNLRVYVEACEELILTYLMNWKYWESLEDRDKVYALIKVYWNKVDRNYILRKAKEKEVLDKLKEVLEDLRYE